MQFSRVLFWGALLAALAACAAGRATVPYTGTNELQSRSKAQIVIPLPPVATTRWKAPLPNAFGAATRFAQIKIQNKSFTVSLNTRNPHCRKIAAGLQCTLTVPAVPGRGEQISALAYGKAGTALPLAEAGATVNVTSGRNTVSLKFHGIASGVTLVPQNRVLHHGAFSFDRIDTFAVDAAGEKILGAPWAPGSYGGGYFDEEIQFKGFSNYYYISGSSSASGFCCYPAIFAYDGIHTGTERVIASALNFKPTSIRLRALDDGPGTPATLAFGASTRYGDYSQTYQVIAQFPVSATGKHTPVREFENPFTTHTGSSSSSNAIAWPVYGEDGSGSFWVGNVRISNDLHILGKVTLPSGMVASARDSAGNLYAYSRCSVFEFPAGQYGSLSPIREIDNVCAGGQELITVDSSGNVYVAGNLGPDATYGNPAQVWEFASNGGSGSIAPIRKIILAKSSAGSDYSPGFLGLDTDGAGNLYVAVAIYADHAPTDYFYEYAPGSTAPTTPLAKLTVTAFAVDESGNIYAPYSTGVGVFPPGSASPIRIVSGNESSATGPILIPKYSAP